MKTDYIIATAHQNRIQKILIQLGMDFYRMPRKKFRNAAVLKLVITNENKPNTYPIITVSVIFEGVVSSEREHEAEYFERDQIFPNKIFDSTEIKLRRPRTVVYLVRHGEGHHNLFWKGKGSPSMVWDALLHNTNGLRRAADSIVTDLFNVENRLQRTIIYLASSPLRRTLETMYLLLDYIVKSVTTSGLRRRLIFKDRICVLSCLRELKTPISHQTFLGMNIHSPENDSILNPFLSTDFDSIFYTVDILDSNQQSAQQAQLTHLREKIDLGIRSIVMDWSNVIQNSMRKYCEEGRIFLADILEYVLKRSDTGLLPPDITFFLNEKYIKHAKKTIHPAQLDDPNIKTFFSNSRRRNNIWFVDTQRRRWSGYGMYTHIKHIVKNLHVEDGWATVHDGYRMGGFTALNRMWQIERRSTIYWLNILSACVIPNDNQNDNLPIRLQLPRDSQLSGLWFTQDTNISTSKDYEQFEAMPLPRDSIDKMFILVSGPSGAGKSFSAKDFIKSLGITNPMCFVDGADLTRENSFFFQTVLYCIDHDHKRNHPLPESRKFMKGIANLVATAKHNEMDTKILKFFERYVVGKGIVDSDKVKEMLLKFIQDKYPFGLSICIPDTLSTPYSIDLVNRYRFASQADKLYNLMVFQHLRKSDCTLTTENETCTGTIVNAEERSMRESKPFSERGFWPSVRAGLEYFKNFSNYYDDLVFIHNCGRKGCVNTIRVFENIHKQQRLSLTRYGKPYYDFQLFMADVQQIIGFVSSAAADDELDRTYGTTIVCFIGMMACALVFAHSSI